jgi:hypothetical protein
VWTCIINQQKRRGPLLDRAVRRAPEGQINAAPSRLRSDSHAQRAGREEHKPNHAAQEDRNPHAAVRPEVGRADARDEEQHQADDGDPAQER